VLLHGLAGRAGCRAGVCCCACAQVSFRPLYVQDKLQKTTASMSADPQLLDFILEHILAAGGVSGARAASCPSVILAGPVP
jgi:hypothetical protein